MGAYTVEFMATTDEGCDELAVVLVFFSRAFHHTMGLRARPIRPNKPGLKPNVNGFPFDRMNGHD